MTKKNTTSKHLLNNTLKSYALEDYKTALISRECSALGRIEVHTGKAKFGIFGDGKELPQLAMARAFKNGDFRSGYYRDQTFMMAIGAFTIENFFAGLYAHADIQADPTSAGRQMGGHFSTHSLDENGNWNNLLKQKNSSSDISCTAGQMPRLLGLAQASKIYREVAGIQNDNFSDNGNEVAWGTIGNASTSEGHFFETINAAGVMQVPMVMCVWDDDYGISVPAKYQTTKENISEILKGFQRDKNSNNGLEIFVVNGWDYPALIETFEKAGNIARTEHVPVLIHVRELTQPLGHSTSGSHERYKTKERLEWEKEFDCNRKMREWVLKSEFATEEELVQMEQEVKKMVAGGRKRAWEAYTNPIKSERSEFISVIDELINKATNHKAEIQEIRNELVSIKAPIRKDIVSAGRKILRNLRYEQPSITKNLRKWIQNYSIDTQPKYSKYLYIENDSNPVSVKEVLPVYDKNSNLVDARIVLRENFDALFAKYSNLLIFGEDTGNIGDVNQSLEGLQKKYGELRIADVGIREATIVGQGIGMAMRGLRPIAEIQYLDYILYGLQTLSDDLASLHYRTFGRQMAPMIIRTRGHRLEGIWHSGSPMGVLLHSLRGVYILTPRNMTKAAGFYNTLLEGNQPAVVIECLNGYRLKEELPVNLGEFKTPIGVVETIKEGKDITIVSYGSTLRIVNQAAEELEKFGISAEIIDAQSLSPFDLNHDVVKSVAKTNRLLIVDEDVSGGASAYILQRVLEEQNAYQYLDSAPQTLTAKDHRTAYGTDGDYFSKPSVDDVFEKVYGIMHEANPNKYPNFLK
ncbi:alpha-ketoacid dehydrogenase subunit alpha/beta [Capnocytophaga cynodegmi]|uniref:3-methyl-2-oxobutanoate dehydrogenase (2-methylpropanoyl-transferring) n=1 Tax=Capnocytophaga cynodegmi TaxID=28189 RepID=A0A0B7HH61_9FLAO|nr:alpha-ketoacid dehydrogenase subunit alpha/beta [Capnocytophaga cynodegmi]CEN37192.1 Pyruvate dehydrogenase E1 component subunit beta [Capnocytophaga cynodegmi]CEN40045.1 Pyruvate dehydrogenase E1 component subunit beta [Capnocytophaga cynodegmi]